MKNKNILILGTTHPQIDAILYCKSQGFKVHGLSYRNEGISLPILDYFEKINIADIDAVFDYAKTHKIDLIYSTGSDIAMPTVAIVSARLNLPVDLTIEQVLLLKDKGSLRRFLADNDLKSVKFKTGFKLEDFGTWNIFPAIIKPVDSQGQRGVRKINNHDDLKKYFYQAIQHSETKKVILEEYFQGSEFNIIVFVFNGNVRFISISDRILLEEIMPEEYTPDMPLGVAKRHVIPSFIPESGQQKIIEFVKKFINLAGIANGCIYMQGKYNNGDFNLIEAAPRLDGGHIWKIIEYKYGVNLLKLNIDRLLGKITLSEQIPDTFGKSNERYQVEFFHQKPGEIFAVPPDFDEEICLEFKFYYKTGESIRISNGFFEKTGYNITKI